MLENDFYDHHIDKNLIFFYFHSCYLLIILNAYFILKRITGNRNVMRLVSANFTPVREKRAGLRPVFLLWNPSDWALESVGGDNEQTQLEAKKKKKIKLKSERIFNFPEL